MFYVNLVCFELLIHIINIVWLSYQFQKWELCSEEKTKWNVKDIHYDFDNSWSLTFRHIS